MKSIDLTGRIFGRWTALNKDTLSNTGKTKWICQCICGSVKSVLSCNLTRGNSKSCGCLNGERIKEISHGQARTINGKQSLGREYISWRSMKQRCYNPAYAPYKNYGGRGITVCNEWRDDFSRFLKDMGPRPADTSIDRIDNNKGYGPDNCQWSNRSTQNKNRRAFNRAGLINESKKLVQN